ncbi:hypothetical protein [Lentzea indica]|uniref:hypothetical protein n=1 Tax=Lentzea indica TaxID=2604800 RepID=UPI0028A9806B|nr:hypothetical protein [Lentzea indica]
MVNAGAGSPNLLLNSRYTFGGPDGDYNDDQRTDTTIWRPSTGQWFVRNVSTTQWGQQGDIPVPGDYNGDQITDVAVWRPSTGQWFVAQPVHPAVGPGRRRSGAGPCGARPPEHGTTSARSA